MTGIATWTDPDWRVTHLGWAATRLEALGRHVVGEPEQLRPRPWSTAFRIQTDAGAAWSKAGGPGVAHEGRLLDVLGALREESAALPLAFDRARAWLLFEDGGPTFRARMTAAGRPGDVDLDAWVRILAAYAAMQRRLEDNVGALLAAEVPDERPGTCPARLERMLDDDAIWTRVDEAERPRAEATRRRLRELQPLVVDLSVELADAGIPVSLDHGDLHGNNIVLEADGRPRFFDWGDAVVGHPFTTLTTTLGSIAHHAGLGRSGRGLVRVHDAYLEAWTDRAPRRSLARTAVLAVDLGHVGKAAAWERALTGLERDEMDGFHGATAAWLADFVARLESRTTVR